MGGRSRTVGGAGGNRVGGRVVVGVVGGGSPNSKPFPLVVGVVGVVDGGGAFVVVVDGGGAFVVVVGSSGGSPNSKPFPSPVCAPAMVLRDAKPISTATAAQTKTIGRRLLKREGIAFLSLLVNKSAALVFLLPVVGRIPLNSIII